MPSQPPMDGHVPTPTPPPPTRYAVHHRDNGAWRNGVIAVCVLVLLGLFIWYAVNVYQKNASAPPGSVKESKTIVVAAAVKVPFECGEMKAEDCSRVPILVVNDWYRDKKANENNGYVLDLKNASFNEVGGYKVSVNLCSCTCVKK